MYREQGTDTGYMIRTMCEKKPLPKEKEIELGRRIQKGDIASRNELVEHNIRLVVEIVKKFKDPRVEFRELFMAGVEGLIKAADRFNPDKDKASAFSTYAHYWIVMYANRYRMKNRNLVRSPLNGPDITRTVYVSDISHKMEAESDYDFTYLLSVMNDFEDKIKDPIISNTVERLLSIVDEKVASMFKKFFGIGCSSMTLGEIGNEHGYTTREGVRQALIRGMQKIHNHPSVRKMLEDDGFLEKGHKPIKEIRQSPGRHSFNFKLHNLAKD